MKLTPWLLTVATFCMVAVITVSYFFKNSSAAVQSEPRLASQSGWILPPAAIGTTMSPSTSTNAPLASAKPIASPPVASLQAQQELAAETYTPGLPILDEPNTTAPSQQQLNILPDVPTNHVADDEPIDPLFGNSTELPPQNTIDEPASPAFVTQQFRSVERTDVRFVDGKAIPKRVAQGSTKSTN